VSFGAHLTRFVASAACLLASCAAPAARSEQRFEATLRVTTDDAEPLSGAKFALNDKPFGSTDRTGTLTVRLRGTEGQAVRLSLTCPEGYSLPEHIPTLRLTQTRRMGQSAPQPLTLDAVCTRETRRVALVVHALPDAILPVEVDGKALTSTDRDGNAHLLLEVDRSQRVVTARLDTSRQPHLSPQNPERRFELTGRDSVLFFAPELSEVRREGPRRSVQPPPRHVPYRIE
jgi:hypothetical protein